MLKKIRKVLVMSLAAVMLLSTVVIASAEECQHTNLECYRKICTGVSDAGIHPAVVNGVTVTCHMERRTYECSYRCSECKEPITVITTTEFWHSVQHD